MGSGRYAAGYEKGRKCSELVTSIHVSLFKEALKKGEELHCIMTQEDKEIRRSLLCPDKLLLNLEYDNRIKATVHFTSTSCNYGGVRYWFLCPDCGERVGKLFFHADTLVCRKCANLGYYSQQWTKTDSWYYCKKAEKIAKQLDSSYEMNHIRPIFPYKPKYMKWSRYWKLRAEFYEYIKKSDKIFFSRISGILRR